MFLNLLEAQITFILICVVQGWQQSAATTATFSTGKTACSKNDDTEVRSWPEARALTVEQMFKCWLTNKCKRVHRFNTVFNIRGLPSDYDYYFFVNDKESLLPVSGLKDDTVRSQYHHCLIS